MLLNLPVVSVTVTNKTVSPFTPGNRLIAGVMLESFLREGNQPIDTPQDLEYGLSLTDKCIGWEETEELIRHFADAADGSEK